VILHGLVVALLLPATMMALVVAKTVALVGASAVPATYLPIDRTVDFLLAEHRGSVPQAFLSTPKTQAETTPATSPTQVSTDGVTLKERARRAIEIGDSLAAIPFAKVAIAMNPQDAASYVYLGAACTRLGMQEKAKAAYEACVRNASVGPTDVCHALAGPTK
jgi:hypothetical protein